MTCGGLCPGLNSVIRELVHALVFLYDAESVLGIRYVQHTSPVVVVSPASFVHYFILIVSKCCFVAHYSHFISMTLINLSILSTCNSSLFLRGGFSGFSESDGYEPIQLTVERVADIHHSGGKSVKSIFTALLHM